MTVDRRSVLGGVAASFVVLGPSRAAAETKAVPADGPTVLEAKAGTFAFKPAKPTPIWGYDGKVPGPVLRLRKSQELTVRLVNKLDQPTTICWHGVRCPNAMDGVGGLTQPPVAPGASFDYRFTPPDSGLFWFHPHVFPQSAEQIGRGLYGVLIVDEEAPPKVDDDMLLVLDDWAFDAKGQIQPSEPGDGPPLVTVNGKPLGLQKQVQPGARLRLRFLNVCATRMVQIGAQGLEATIIAIDGQPSELFAPARGVVPIGPGSRFELMVDCPREAGKTAKVMFWHGDRAAEDLLTVQTKGEPLPAYPAVAKLPDNPALPTRIHLERALKRNIAIEKLAEGKGAWRWSLGGVPSDGSSGKPLFAVKRGEPVSLALVNKTDEPQQMHVHGHVFRVLHDLDDGWDPYWRDSILMAPGKTKHIAFVADNPGKWVIESLMLDRQVSGLAGWFQVG